MPERDDPDAAPIDSQPLTVVQAMKECPVPDFDFDRMPTYGRVRDVDL